MTDTKVRKTAQQKAQEALDAAGRKVTSLTERLDKAKAAVTALETDLAAAKANRDYVAQHPALTQPTVVGSEPEVDLHEAPETDAPQATLPGGPPF